MKSLAHEILNVESGGFDVSDETYSTLDDLLERGTGAVRAVTEEIEMNKPHQYTKREAIKVLQSIGDFLETEGFHFENEKEILFGDKLHSKNFVCRDFSYMYYSIGEKLGLPISLVLAPSHVIVRFDLGDGEYFYWEPVKRLTFDEKEILSKRNIHAESITNGAYLRKLKRDEIKAIAYLTAGMVKFKENQYDDWISYTSKAIELNPKYVSAYYNRARAFCKKNDFTDPFSDLDEAIKLDPNNADAYGLRVLTNIFKHKYINVIRDLMTYGTLKYKHTSSKNADSPYTEPSIEAFSFFRHDKRDPDRPYKLRLGPISISINL